MKKQVKICERLTQRLIDVILCDPVPAVRSIRPLLQRVHHPVLGQLGQLTRLISRRPLALIRTVRVDPSSNHATIIVVQSRPRKESRTAGGAAHHRLVAGSGTTTTTAGRQEEDKLGPEAGLVPAQDGTGLEEKAELGGGGQLQSGQLLHQDQEGGTAAVEGGTDAEPLPLPARQERARQDNHSAAYHAPPAAVVGISLVLWLVTVD